MASILEKIASDPLRYGRKVIASRRSPQQASEIASGDVSQSAIYIIDFISWRSGGAESEIVTRLIHHAANLDEAQENARTFIRGVNFINAQAVKILNGDGIELCSWTLNCDQ